MDKEVVLWGRVPCRVHVIKGHSFEVNVTLKASVQTGEDRSDGPTRTELEDLMLALERLDEEWSEDYELVEASPVK